MKRVSVTLAMVTCSGLAVRQEGERNPLLRVEGKDL